MFGLLVDRYQEAFLRKASYILRSPDLAEDVVQDTFLKIYKYADTFTERPKASFNSWAYKILTNTCYSYANRKTEEQGRVRVTEFADLDLLSEPQTLTSDTLSVAHSILSRLPRRLSRLLELYFFEDKSYEEIAVIENISLSAVKSGIHRAKKQSKDIAINMI